MQRYDDVTATKSASAADSSPRPSRSEPVDSAVQGGHAVWRACESTRAGSSSDEHLDGAGLGPGARVAENPRTRDHGESRRTLEEQHERWGHIGHLHRGVKTRALDPAQKPQARR